VTADVGRALLVWPLVASLVATFGTASFVLLSVRERPFDARAVAPLLDTLWRLLAAVIFLLSPLVLLNVTADMAAVSWTRALGLVPQMLTGTHAGRVFEWFLPIALALFLSACLPLRQSIRTTNLFLLSGVMLLLQALLSPAIDKASQLRSAFCTRLLSPCGSAPCSRSGRWRDAEILPSCGSSPLPAELRRSPSGRWSASRSPEPPPRTTGSGLTRTACCFRSTVALS